MPAPTRLFIGDLPQPQPRHQGRLRPAGPAAGVDGLLQWRRWASSYASRWTSAPSSPRDSLPGARHVRPAVGHQDPAPARAERRHGVAILRDEFRRADALQPVRSHRHHRCGRVEPVRPEYGWPHRLYRTVFSVANIIVAPAADSAAALVGGLAVHDGWSSLIVPTLAGATAFFFCNTLMLAEAVALESRKSVTTLWRQQFLWSAPACFFGAVAGDRGLSLRDGQPALRVSRDSGRPLLLGLSHLPRASSNGKTPCTWPPSGRSHGRSAPAIRPSKPREAVSDNHIAASSGGRGARRGPHERDEVRA